MPDETSTTNVHNVHDVLSQLHDAGILNLDTSVRDVLKTKDALGKLRSGGDVATSVVAWDGYGLVIASALNDPAQLIRVSDRLRGMTEGGR